MRYSKPLKKNYEFKRLYSRGKQAVSPCMAVYCRPNRTEVDRIGITVGGKIGNAVKRNRVRRRLKEIYRLNEHLLRTGFDIVVVARVRAEYAPYRELEESFLSLCGKLKLLR
ncbi:ribonuclease P protein component [Papillibacter cinnamivorans]|uniref:Ribonuclease P protein component n=1 Tax=Papillibacter cinnamivorans DSM 12816 TaxID=1122930 RepID=A0A1W2A996_9FIRM|nr:ribonuclease P protein component [Papillibacter cinnamivorans]SMC57319.1 ribonuclease P protein component [Papillibacter cinnamivorans DSM 12816]